jgi:DNA-binding HxlR family transcriptional regulator
MRSPGPTEESAQHFPRVSTPPAEGISEKMLAHTLRTLEADDIVGGREPA